MNEYILLSNKYNIIYAPLTPAVLTTKILAPSCNPASATVNEGTKALALKINFFLLVSSIALVPYRFITSETLSSKVHCTIIDPFSPFCPALKYTYRLYIN